MSKLLVVFGATGNQGGSIAHVVLDDPQLSKEYKVRAVTRKASNPAAEALKKKGAEIVEADMDTPSTLKAALEGAHTAFLTTNTQYAGHTREIETRQGKAQADAAVTAGAKYLIWSSMVNVSKMSNGTNTKVDIFDVKEEVEQYIRSLPVQSSFLVPGSFMQNYLTHQAPRPSSSGDGTFVITNIWKPETEVPLIDITDTGKWVAAILANPDEYAGKNLNMATKCYSQTEAAEIISKVTGKTVKHQQLPDEVFKGFVPENIYYMQVHIRDDGYFGKEQRKEVEKWAAVAKGKLTTLEEWVAKNPLKLE